jgi:hypothetical protein
MVRASWVVVAARVAWCGAADGPEATRVETMAQPITFKRDGGTVTITVDLKGAMQGTTSSGNAGSYGGATVEYDGKTVALNLNVFAKKGKRAQVVAL